MNNGRGVIMFQFFLNLFLVVIMTAAVIVTVLLCAMLIVYLVGKLALLYKDMRSEINTYFSGRRR